MASFGGHANFLLFQQLQQLEDPWDGGITGTSGPHRIMLLVFTPPALMPRQKLAKEVQLRCIPSVNAQTVWKKITKACRWPRVSGM
jgi:hypothetical protein